MKVLFAAASVAALVSATGPAALAQVATPATPRVGVPLTSPRSPEPFAPVPQPAPAVAIPSNETVPANLTLPQALAEAEASSPVIQAAIARASAAQARVRQAGYRINPELSVEVENFAGTGDYSGARGLETTVAVNQRLDLGGRRRARVSVARAELAAEELRLAIARADLGQQVREQFARAVTARDKLRITEDNATRATELARIAGQLVDAGREPPLRAIRARSAAAQAQAELAAARADEAASRRTLGGLFGSITPPESVTGSLIDLDPRAIDPEQSLDVRLADLELAVAEAEVGQQVTQRRLDPAVGIGVRQFRGSGDIALVGGVSMPIPVFDRNQGNIAAARANVTSFQARRANTLAIVTVRARNAIAAVEAAQARVQALEGAAVPEAFEALRLAQLSYREGRTALIELLDAQNAYRSAELALIDARLALALATAELGRVAAQ
ncbi:TolC family protein [Allosphingosinicella sp.]|uniref:TolC family protein n=1 Tax=Allosphingosinicella sp. TaxID=2823234 RepID=UPI0037837A66